MLSKHVSTAKAFKLLDECELALQCSCALEAGKCCLAFLMQKDCLDLSEANDCVSKASWDLELRSQCTLDSTAGEADSKTPMNVLAL